MNKYKFLYLIWILPAYMLFISVQQAMVYKSSIDTYENGTTYLAQVTDFEIKQIAAQSNGYVNIRFEIDDGTTIDRRLSLSIQMAQQILESPTIPVRYREGAFTDIVMMPTFYLQKSTSLFNMCIAIVGLLATLLVAYLVHRYARGKLRDGDEELIIERVDT